VDHGQIVGQQSGDKQLADAIHFEHLLCDDRTAKDRRNPQGNHGDHRD
jgi:hypothetical protein